jgi:hypothetical protein
MKNKFYISLFKYYLCNYHINKVNYNYSIYYLKATEFCVIVLNVQSDKV